MATDPASTPAAGIPPETAQQLMQALATIPEVQALIDRKTSAVSAPLAMLGEQSSHVASVLMDVFPAATGLDATISPKTQHVVFFDPEKYTEAQIDEADAAGTLAEIAPPVQVGEAAPAGSPAPSAAPAANPAAGLVSGGPTGPQPLQAANLAPLPPTKQKNPAAGSIVNDLAKRPI